MKQLLLIFAALAIAAPVWAVSNAEEVLVPYADGSRTDWKNNDAGTASFEDVDDQYNVTLISLWTRTGTTGNQYQDATFTAPFDTSAITAIDSVVYVLAGAENATGTVTLEVLVAFGDTNYVTEGTFIVDGVGGELGYSNYRLTIDSADTKAELLDIRIRLRLQTGPGFLKDVYAYATEIQIWHTRTITDPAIAFVSQVTSLMGYRPQLSFLDITPNSAIVDSVEFDLQDSVTHEFIMQGTLRRPTDEGDFVVDVRDTIAISWLTDNYHSAYVNLRAIAFGRDGGSDTTIQAITIDSSYWTGEDLDSICMLNEGSPDANTGGDNLTLQQVGGSHTGVDRRILFKHLDPPEPAGQAHYYIMRGYLSSANGSGTYVSAQTETDWYIGNEENSQADSGDCSWNNAVTTLGGSSDSITWDGGDFSTENRDTFYVDADSAGVLRVSVPFLLSAVGDDSAVGGIWNVDPTATLLTIYDDDQGANAPDFIVAYDSLPTLDVSNTVVFQHDGISDYNNTEDATIKSYPTSGGQNRNYGSTPSGSFGESKWDVTVYREDMRWPLFHQEGSFTAATIDSGQIELYLFAENDPAEDPWFYVYLIDSAWEVGTGSVPADTINDLSWLHRADSSETSRQGDSLWGAAGGSVGILIDSFQVTIINTWKVIVRLSKAQCSTWYADTAGNWGIQVRAKTEATNATYKATRAADYTTAAFRRKFTIYHTGTGGEEPPTRRRNLLLGFACPGGENFDEYRVPDYVVAAEGSLDLLGDLNHDGHVSSADIIRMADYVLKGGADLAIEKLIEVVTSDCIITADDRRIDGQYVYIFIEEPEGSP